jgi:hypothetical protein
MSCPRRHESSHLSTHDTSGRHEECFRKWQFRSYLRNSLRFVQPERSLPRSQDVATLLVLSLMNPVHALQFYFFKMHFNIILPCVLRSPKSPPSFRFPVLLSPTHATCPANLILLHLMTLILFHAQYKSWRFLLCSLLQYPVISSLSGQNIFLSSLFLNTLSLCSFLNVADQVSHP